MPLKLVGPEPLLPSLQQIAGVFVRKDSEHSAPPLGEIASSKEFVRRRAFKGALVSLLVVPALILLSFVPGFGQVLNGTTTLWISICFGLALYRYRLWVEKRRLREREYRVCLSCGYGLSGLEERGSCPECGTRYNIPAARAELESLIP